MRRLAWIPLGLGLALAGASFVGCGSEQHWSTDPSWQGQDAPRTQGASDIEATNLTPTTPNSDDSRGQSWFGVRHDLSMRPGTPRTLACGCLAAEVGMPGKQAFLWDGQVPTVGPDAVIVAISAHGVECPAEPDESKRRASISAVDRDGDDVVIEIEELPEGRPLALGAVIPKPGAGGAVYLQPKNKKVRFVPQGGANRCKIKAPAAAADVPASPPGAP
jgi:hypothetical protein